MQKQKNKIDPLDKDTFYRWFHLHCFSHIYRILTAKQPKSQFAYPRFQLFRQIIWQQKNNCQTSIKFSLFIRVLFTFWKQIIIGASISIFFACLNLLIPLMIKNFLHFMHQHDIDQNQISSTQILIQGFIVLQLLRIIFGQHAKRLFYQLAIKIQSSLSLMIVKKSLTISNQVRNKITQSQILHLQNIDLKLVFTMFQNMYLAIQSPFTILVSIYFLYLQNYKYGLIGIYWFVIAFLIQRQLDSKMTHCNDTKLKLIQARSKVNYQIIGKIRTAKLLGHQQLLIQKNNDYFIAENHDHKMFYQYVTLYDISLLMLPILVIVTIAFYDLNQPNPISVSQVYVLLSLLGICYLPMKSFRTLTLNFHDGLRSIRRIQGFLNQPDQPPNQKLKLLHHSNTASKKSSRKNSIHNQQSRESRGSSTISKRKSHLPQNWPLLTITNHLVVEPGRQRTRLKLHINVKQNINFHRGQRIIVCGKVGSGIQTFFDALIGMARIQIGQIHLNEKIAYLNEQHFFRNTSIRQNIRFFNNQTTNQQIQKVYKQLKLDQDLKLTAGLQGNLDDQYKYNSAQLHKISLARVLCSDSHIYLFDKLFQPFNASDQKLIQQILRQKQYEGKLIIILNYPNNTFEKDDKILIFQKGQIKSFKTYHQMIQTQDQDFKKFYHVVSAQKQLATQRQMDIFSHFSSKLSLKFSLSEQQSITKEQKQKIIGQYAYPVLVFAMHLWKQYQQKSHKKITNYGIRHYIKKFLSAVRFKQFIYIFLIIAVAQFMHIFIHFYIGHLEQQHGENNYIKFRDMIIVQFVLTVGLAGIIWLQGQVSSQIAIIQGNNLYKNSLSSLGQNKLSWFKKQYSVKIANRFNHDYQEVFIALHTFLNIYKNIVILIATIYFISQSKKSLIIMTFGIFITYLTVYWIVRSVQRKVVNNFEQYKYHYVRVLQESIGGAKLIQLQGASASLLQNAKQAYKEFASYKIAESYTAYGEQIFCDLVSLIIFTVVLNYGLQSKIQGNTKSIAEVATMIHLLIGVFDVLKNIVKDAVHFETFFKINLLPFVQIIKQKTPQTLMVEEYIQKSMAKYEQQIIKMGSSIKNSLEASRISGKSQSIDPMQISTLVNKMQDTIKSQNYLQTPTKNQLLSQSKSHVRRSLSIDKLVSPYLRYDIQFKNVILHQSKYHQPVFQVYPLTVKIKQGQKVLFWEQNDYLKNYLIYALTKNLPMFSNTEIMALQRTPDQINNKEKTLVIGGRDICCIEKQELQKVVQILIDHDFYVQGTLQDNISWKNPNYDPKIALDLANYLQFRRQLPQILKFGMKVHIHDPDKALIKKMTILRILSLRPKILIIKDTESIIQNFLIVDEVCRMLGPVTIIKISSNIDQAFDIDRIIYTKNLEVIQDRTKQQAINHPFSAIGHELQKGNLSGLVYANKMNMTLIGAKFGPPNQLIV